MTVYKVGSPEYEALMKKWSDDAWNEEVTRDYEEYKEREENYKTK
jgi:hypothetical protein